MSGTRSLDALLSLVDAATARRRVVTGMTTAYRWLDGSGDGLPHVVVDRYGDFAVLSLTADLEDPFVRLLGEALLSRGVQGVYVKRRPRADLRREAQHDLAPTTPLVGLTAPEPLVVEEHGMHLAVRLGDGLSTGLFTDQRDNRFRVRELARGARVLNLFSYTCSFTVSAALGGAIGTTSVDLSQRALDRGKENLALNGLDPAAHRFVRADAVAFLSRAPRRPERYDLVVLDPPSFGTRARGTFSVEKDYGTLATHATALLVPGGRLLAVTNHRKTSLNALTALLRGAVIQSGRTLTDLAELPPPADHTDRPDGAAATKSVLVEIG